MNLEICCGSSPDALAALACGADRIELNSALPLGGLTPSPGMLEAVLSRGNACVLVMIRPRPGDFLYSPEEADCMIRDIRLLTGLGAQGIVLGALTPEGDVDRDMCARLLDSCPPGIIRVFHRALDLCPRPEEALEQLIDLGFDHVLTSGGMPTAPEGADRIARLVRLARGRLRIVPGSGIHPDNVVPLLEKTGCDDVHLSATCLRTSPGPRGLPGLETDYRTCDAALVRRMRQILDGTGSAGNRP